jgi:hypothetical protein
MVTTWDENNKEKMREYRRNWNKRNPEAHAKANREYAKRNPEKIMARNRANYHLRNLKKEGFEFHHKDYSNPLLVEIIPIREHQINIHGIIT